MREYRVSDLEGAARDYFSSDYESSADDWEPLPDVSGIAEPGKATPTAPPPVTHPLNFSRPTPIAFGKSLLS